MSDSAPPQPSSISPREFFGSLDSLRGLAALLVVLYHLPPWHPALFQIAPIRHGHTMVNFFFVLSGFVLYHSYAGRLSSRVAVKRFVLLRLGRLYPVHLFFLAPFVCLELGKHFGGPISEGAIAPTLANIARSLILNVLLLQGLVQTDPALNFPNWSISCEFYAYLVFAAVVAWVASRRLWLACAVLCLGGIVVPPLLSGPDVVSLANFIGCVGGFFCGCLTCMAYRRWRGVRLPALLATGLPLVLLSPLCFGWSRHPYVPGWAEQASYPFSALLILCVVWRADSLINRTLQTRPLRWLGSISYSLYMGHAIVHAVTRRIAQHLAHGPVRVMDGISAPSLALGSALLLSVGSTVVALLVAATICRLVEDPGRLAMRRALDSEATSARLPA